MKLEERTWPAIAEHSRDLPVVLPVAAIEQHGHHLPLATDSLLLGAIVERVEQARGERVLIAPLMWLGNSHHHLDFEGTLSCPPRVYLDLLAGLLDNLIGHGFRRLLVLNGHGGNDVPGKQALFEVRQKHRCREDLLLLFATYWTLGSQPSESVPEIVQEAMGHACEWETSMMLHLAPHLVGDYRNAPPVDPGDGFGPAARAWTTRERSIPGHIGYPHQACAAKGERLLDCFTSDVLQLIDRVAAWDGRSWESESK